MVAAVAIAVGLALLAWIAYPEELRVRTDIVGYPIFHDFNAGRWVVGYMLVVVALPALAIAAYAVITRLVRGRGPGLRAETVPAEPGISLAADEQHPRWALVSAVARAAFVGALWALTLALALEVGDEWWLVLGLPVTAAYALGIYLLAPAGNRIDGMATLNGIGAAFLGLGIAALSSAVRVRELDTGTVVHYDIAPEWLLIGIGVALGAVVARAVWRARSRRARSAETRVLVFLAGPVALFLLLAYIAGDVPKFDLFEAGQGMAGGRLLGEGWIPYRDVLLIHGPLEDALLGRVGMSLLEDSLWGNLTGRALIVTPIVWISNFALAAYLYRHNRLFLLGTQVVLLLAWIDELGLERMVFVPLVLLSLGLLLDRATWPRVGLFMTLSVGQVALVPETAIITGSAWAVVLFRDLCAGLGWVPYDEPWARTLRCVIAGLAAGVVLLAILIALGALDEFFAFLTTYGGRIELVSGIPAQWHTIGPFEFWVFAIPVVILIAWAYAAARIGSRRWFSNRDLVVGAAVIALIPYYVKFLARADGHIYHVATLALVPFTYIVYRLVTAAEQALRDRTVSLWGLRHPVTLVLLAVAVLAGPHPATKLIEEASTRVATVASAKPFNERVGYSGDHDLAQMLPVAQAAVNQYAGPGGEIFDLTNSPGLFYYVTGGKPATRYIEMTTAVREHTQEDVVSELEEARPPLVVFSSLGHGLANWDGISNPVRNYLISDWILDNYRPVSSFADYVLMAPKDARVPTDDDAAALYFQAPECDWGQTPNFFDQEPEDGVPATQLEIDQAGMGTLVSGRGWAADIGARLPAAEILIADGSKVVAGINLIGGRPDVADALGIPALVGSGFEFSDLLVAGDPERLRVFGVTHNGLAGQIAGPDDSPPARLIHENGRRIPVVSGAIEGNLDQLETTELERLRLNTPANLADYDWLELSAERELPETDFILTDDGDGGHRAITFTTAEGEREIRVRVGSCSQWHGYGKGPLFLYALPETGGLAAKLR